MNNEPTKQFCPLLEEMKELFGPPPVLSSEDVSAYYKLLEQLIACQQPKDFIEKMLLQDIANEIWNDLRYGRIKTSWFERKLAWHFKYQGLRRDSEEKRNRTRTEAAGLMKIAKSDAPTEEESKERLETIIEGTVEETDNLLVQASQHQAHGRALEANFAFFERIDQLHSKALERRNDSLAHLERYQDSSASKAAPSTPNRRSHKRKIGQETFIADDIQEHE